MALYTVLDREAKYKAMSFIDTFVYRGGDQVGVWTFSIVAVTWIAAPLAGLWLLTALALGRAQLRRELGPLSPDASRVVH